ncbi:putative alpha/beta hydrolase [Mycolicibacterium mengxianglii]|uniref:putative alpha/beta hydrolase n=1 Tax=Mycolicibacterium mengxianglii TaxID=2736649 RepID=UPI0018EEF721|nr:hypothetical protein [Mycolicibacterium mengxianglii]
MQLKYLSVKGLIAEAGGDPWGINATVQSGEPGQISELATAFYDAGVSMSETSEEFSRAKDRFEDSWNRENGDHPINDSAEVKRATVALNLSREQLTRVGVDLQKIAAALAETQRSCAECIATLENNLQAIDDAIDRTVQQTGLPVDELDIEPIENMAELDTRDALTAVTNARDSYAGQLTRSMSEIEAEGYDPSAIDTSDGNGQTDEAAAEMEAAQYGFMQRAADQVMVDSPGPATPDKDAAADRLRDYATISGADASPAAVELAAQRLDDYQQAMMPVPGRRDSILGVDSRSRAQSRLRMQKMLEEGTPWQQPMSRDEATAWMNEEEAQMKATTLEKTEALLVQAGMAQRDADAILDAMSSGLTLADLQQYADVLGTAGQDFDGRVSIGRHAVDRFDPDTVRAIGQLGKHVKGAGSLLEVGLAFDAWLSGAPTGETFGGLGGSFAGGAGGGAALGFLGGSALGPGGAFAGMIIGSVGGGVIGEEVGRYAGSKLFD